MQINSGELPYGSHHTQPKLFSQFLFQTQTISLRLQGTLKMIAKLSSAVFYTITRKLLGAFYVDQKKKGLLPSTLPSEHEQWGIKRFTKASWTQYPVSFEKECYTVLLSHQNPITDGTSDLSKEWEIHEYTTTQFWTVCNMYACTLFWFAVGR